MKVILDTNIFVSAIFWGGKPQDVLKRCLEKQYEIVVSEEILDEYFRVSDLLAKKYVPGENVRNILDYVVKKSTLVETVKIGPITADPKDDMFFEAAISSNCKMIISGDKHLLEKNAFRDISVMTAAEFLLVEKAK